MTEDDVLSVDLSGVKNSPKVFFCVQVPFPIDQILYRVAFVKTKNKLCSCLKKNQNNSVITNFE